MFARDLTLLARSLGGVDQTQAASSIWPFPLVPILIFIVLWVAFLILSLVRIYVIEGNE